MDFSQFNIRDAAEDGAFCHLVHPKTFQPLYDDDGAEVGFNVRGNASRSAQQALAKARKDGKTNVQSADDLHQAEIKTALALIIDAVNIDVPDKDGKNVPAGSDKGLIRKALDMTFPELRAREDDEKTDDYEGGMDLINKPFANQVIRFAARQDNYLGE